MAVKSFTTTATDYIANVFLAGSACCVELGHVPDVPQLLPGQGGVAEPQEALACPLDVAEDNQVQVLLERIAGP
jgi:hypothetical protein